MGKFSSVICLLVAVALAVGCNNAPKKKTEAVASKTEDKRAAIPVEAQLPTRGPISEYFETNARVEAERSVQVTSEGVGKCTKVYVDEGDTVNTSDVLAELDASELRAQIASANAQLQKASSDYGRSKQLFAEGLIAKSEYDNARYGFEQQEASLNQLNVQLNNMTIRAPISGIVTKKMIQTGQLVSSGTASFEVVDPQSYIININAPEKDYLPRIKVGQKASVQLDSLDEEIQAKVRRINPAVDAESGTVKVTLDFEKSALPKLRDRAFARVNVVLTTRDNALLLPKGAIVEENARKYVYVIAKAGEIKAEDDTTDQAAADPDALIANRVEIKTGLEDSAQVEVLEGIEDGLAVVTVGQTTLKSGAEVKLTSTQEELLARSNVPAEQALEDAEVEHAEQKKKMGQGL